ncbi:hypothetical protein B0H10DRAFT_1964333 [Mycena sp. CBHHK59/15]|nr:hypothetical protein B0H10DRAFT_1964333 [Mycena sp. CBHHK59/15]
MAYRSRFTLPRGRGGGRAATSDTGLPDTSSDAGPPTLHRRGLGRPVRRAAPTATSDANMANVPGAAAPPLLPSRGRKAKHTGRLTRQSAMVPESNRPNVDGIALAEPFPAAAEATLSDLAPPATAAAVEPTPPDEPTTPSTETRNTLHPNWCVRGVIYLVAFLHTRYHVTFRACGLILSCLNFVFSALPGDLLRTARMLLTLKTVFSRLGARDQFTVYPVCYQCHKVFHPGVASDMICPDCELELFRPATRRLFDALDDGQPTVFESADNEESFGVNREAHMVAPIQLLSVALAEFFARPGMVAAVKAWKTRTTVEGDLKCMQDGEVWKTLRGHDGELFFFGPSANEELRLGVTFSLDW